MQKKIYKFYMGDGIKKNADYLNRFVQMVSDIVFVYPLYDAIELHRNAKISCYL